MLWTNSTWEITSLPSMPSTCPFCKQLIISMPIIVLLAVWKDLKFNIGLILFLINLWSCSRILLRYLFRLNIVVCLRKFSDFSCFITKGYAGFLSVLIISGLSGFFRIFLKNLSAARWFLLAFTPSKNIDKSGQPSLKVLIFRKVFYPRGGEFHRYSFNFHGLNRRHA